MKGVAFTYPVYTRRGSCFWCGGEFCRERVLALGGAGEIHLHRSCAEEMVKETLDLLGKMEKEEGQRKER